MQTAPVKDRRYLITILAAKHDPRDKLAPARDVYELPTPSVSSGGCHAHLSHDAMPAARVVVDADDEYLRSSSHTSICMCSKCKQTKGLGFEAEASCYTLEIAVSPANHQNA